jgi:hypothetical protein
VTDTVPGHDDLDSGPNDPAPLLLEHVEALANKYQRIYDHDTTERVRVSEVVGDLRCLLALDYWERLQ